MKKLLLISIGLLSLFPLVACEESEMRLAGGGGALVSSRGTSNPPAANIAGTGAVKMQDPGNIEGVQETHGVTERKKCQEMAEKFKRQGRKVTLKEVKRNLNPGATLQYICIFVGEDAQVGYYQDRSHN